MVVMKLGIASQKQNQEAGLPITSALFIQIMWLVKDLWLTCSAKSQWQAIALIIVNVEVDLQWPADSVFKLIIYFSYFHAPADI